MPCLGATHAGGRLRLHQAEAPSLTRTTRINSAGLIFHGIVGGLSASGHHVVSEGHKPLALVVPARPRLQPGLAPPDLGKELISVGRPDRARLSNKSMMTSSLCSWVRWPSSAAVSVVASGEGSTDLFTNSSLTCVLLDRFVAVVASACLTHRPVRDGHEPRRPRRHCPNSPPYRLHPCRPPDGRSLHGCSLPRLRQGMPLSGLHILLVLCKRGSFGELPWSPFCGAIGPESGSGWPLSTVPLPRGGGGQH